MKLVATLVLILSLPVFAFAQTNLPESVDKEIHQQCIEFNDYDLRKVCIQQNVEAYESWNKFITDPEFNKISEITTRCSVDWPSYMMRVECVKLETKALIRMNNLVNLHGISKPVMAEAVNNCSEFQQMGYSVLEQCIREKIVSITGKPLP